MSQSKILIITTELINNSNSALLFDEYIEDIEVYLNDSEYEYYKCVIALNNIPYNLKTITINIKKMCKEFGGKTNVTIGKNGDIQTRIFLSINLPDIMINSQKYTFDEFLMYLKIPYDCKIIINKN
jgi:hypothetical protein